MSTIIEDYHALLTAFLEHRATPDEFVRDYLRKFKNEDRDMGEATYDALDTLFGDVDAYTTDDVLLTEQPDFYLDEATLRSRVASARAALV